MEFKCSAITKTIIFVLMIFVIKSNALNIRDYEEGRNIDKLSHQLKC